MITIRTAQKNEVNDLQTLNDQIFINNPQYDPDIIRNWGQSETGKQYFTNLLNNPDAYCLIAEENQKKIAYLAATPKTVNHRQSKYLEIENLGVIPEYQSKGIATKLLNHCETWAKEKGFQKIYLGTYAKNNTAINFYKKNNFSEIDISLEKTI